MNRVVIGGLRVRKIGPWVPAAGSKPEGDGPHAASEWRFRGPKVEPVFDGAELVALTDEDGCRAEVLDWR